MPKAGNSKLDKCPANDKGAGGWAFLGLTDHYNIRRILPEIRTLNK